MSFLGNIVDSIGGDKPPAPPRPIDRSKITNAGRPVLVSNTAASRPFPNPKPAPLNGLKRKAEDEPAKGSEKSVRPNPAPGLSSSVMRRPAAPPLNAPKTQPDKLAMLPPKIAERVIPDKSQFPKPPMVTTSNTSTGPPPSKGSYADIMARAKLASEQKAKGQIGTIKHQTTVKEKHSKLTERRREEQERAKAGKDLSRTKGNGRLEKPMEKKRSVSPVKKERTHEAKAPRPPLNAPPSKYQGTMGTSSQRTAHKREEAKRRRKYDDYLGTDEEDDSEMDEGGEEDDYGSDASSDMEARYDELDEEETKTLQQAKADDAREKALEDRLKREKEERRKRLEILAKKK